VRSTERACPFCDAILSTRPAIASTPMGRLGRAALFAFRTTTVAALGTVSACGDGQPPQPPIETPPEESIMQPYGAPPDPRPPQPQPPQPPGPQLPDPTIAQPYGAPPVPVPEEPPVPDEPPRPPTHDHEHHRRPPRTVTVPAYGISPRPDRPGDLE
jgi:hypothetical protein